MRALKPLRVSFLHPEREKHDFYWMVLSKCNDCCHIVSKSDECVCVAVIVNTAKWIEDKQNAKDSCTW